MCPGRFFQSIDFRIRPATDRNQHAIKHLLGLFDAGAFKAHAHAILLFFYGSHFLP